MLLLGRAVKNKSFTVNYIFYFTMQTLNARRTFGVPTTQEFLLHGCYSKKTVSELTWEPLAKSWTFFCSTQHWTYVCFTVILQLPCAFNDICNLDAIQCRQEIVRQKIRLLMWWRLFYYQCILKKYLVIVHLFILLSMQITTHTQNIENKFVFRTDNHLPLSPFNMQTC